MSMNISKMHTVIMGAIAVAVVGAVVAGYAPGFLLLLVVCPLMMVFMMMSMGGMSGRRQDESPENEESSSDRTSKHEV